jgi:hypothetical protein
MSNNHYPNMNSILKEAKEDFELFHNNHEKYKEKVKKLSDLFKLEFRDDFLPTYLVGNFEDDIEYKYVLFSINPGFNEEQNKREEELKKNSWKEYVDFIKNFFNLFKQYGMKSPYYKRLSKLFSGLDPNENLDGYSKIYDYYQKHLINIDLIPYHSIRFGISNNLTKEQEEYLVERSKSNINFVKNLLEKICIKLIIFNGKLFYLLLIENNLIHSLMDSDVGEPYSIKHIKMYTFKFRDIPCVLFDKFLTQPAFGLSNEDLKNKIPNEIRNRFNI